MKTTSTYSKAIKQICETEKEIQELRKRIELLEESRTKYVTTIKEAMKTLNENKVNTKYGTLTYVGETTRTSVDTSKLKSQFNEVYKSCLKTSKVSDSLRIKLLQ